ncbi:DMT family transporter [Jannaschia sp. LMIT008]|uniref:DMT family transporter n=1 Tax=Jannaschia maritima TaxID=3032585 RepID=UPI00281146E0|nr:DMT family transporter [Jannaschia sp. LMIT008]
MTRSDDRLGIAMMSATMLLLAVQDGFSRHLAGEYNVWMVVTIRYWFFAILALGLAARRPGGLRRAWGTPRPILQACRGVLLVFEICGLVAAFTVLGLTESHAIFALCPLLIAALSVPLLGERVGLWRWLAIGVGFVGVLVILDPGAGVVSPFAVLALACAFAFALYSVLTRLVARTDDALTSFVWTGVAGAIAITPLGLWAWEPMAPADWGWMTGLCAVAALSMFMLIKTYETAEASVVQPFAYLQLVFVTIIGVTVFDEVVRREVLIGGGIVIGAGLFTLWRARRTGARGPQHGHPRA